MPISGWDPIDPIMARLNAIQPKRVLDLGIGTGQWGFLCRNYLDMRYGNFQRRNWKLELEGVEGCDLYRNPTWDLYDKVHVVDIKKFLDETVHRYDAILMIEVLEHFNKHQGLEVLEQLKRKGKHVFVSYANMEQGAAHGNHLEIHQSVWSDEDILKVYPGAEAIHKTGVGRFFYAKF